MWKTKLNLSSLIARCDSTRVNFKVERFRCLNSNGFDFYSFYIQKTKDVRFRFIFSFCAEKFRCTFECTERSYSLINLSYYAV